jgi:hypothetical protein
MLANVLVRFQSHSHAHRQASSKIMLADKAAAS